MDSQLDHTRLEEDLQDLYENAPCGYLSSLPDGTIIQVNGTFLRWSGYTREQLVGSKRFQSLLSAGGRIFYETHYAPLLRMQGSVREIAVDMIRADGSELPALVNSTMKTDGAGQPLVIRTTIFDATERREYERELLRAQERARDSEARARELARTLQASLIPPEPPVIPGLELAAAYRPAGDGDEIGGDFYDAFELANDHWAIVLGDVQGKGAEAARVTALARYTLRALSMRVRGPASILRSLNRALLTSQETKRFCTALYARIHVHEGNARFTVAAAGHSLPIRVSPDGSIDRLGTPGLIVGAFDDIDVSDSETTLAPGDIVLFFTDGIPEARGPSGFYGERRMEELLASHRHEPAERIARALVDDAVEFQDGRTRDDIAIVVLRVPG